MILLQFYLLLTLLFVRIFSSNTIFFLHTIGAISTFFSSRITLHLERMQNYFSRVHRVKMLEGINAPFHLMYRYFKRKPSFGR